MNVHKEKIRQFQEKIFLFYQKNKRDLPWRNTTNPYHILLSEFMLQQTQVSRVITYYNQWITQWPTINDLARASRINVLKAWMGLGYNTRVVHLHTAVKKIVADYNGDVLEAMDQYQEIPGVGKYTSQAVLIFATNADLATVDTNIRRIFISEFHLSEKTSDKDIWDLAERCVPKGRSKDWHNALMDYGALYLTSKKTGIKPKTIQSRFEGSDRQIRAHIVRTLLNQPTTFADLKKTVQTNQQRLRQILEKMMKEKLITKTQSTYQLKNE